MMKWTNQELDEFCEKAIEILNRKKGLQLVFRNCWFFSNSVGSNFHIVYRNEFLNNNYEVVKFGSILEDRKVPLDGITGTGDVQDIKMRIILRIAYYIYQDCKRNMRDK